MTAEQLPPYYRDLLAERAAIMEYEGKMSYADANRAALADVLRVMDRDKEKSDDTRKISRR